MLFNPILFLDTKFEIINVNTLNFLRKHILIGQKEVSRSISWESLIQRITKSPFSSSSKFSKMYSNISTKNLNTFPFYEWKYIHLLTLSLIRPSYTIRATIFEKAFRLEKFPKTEYFPTMRIISLSSRTCKFSSRTCNFTSFLESIFLNRAIMNLQYFIATFLNLMPLLQSLVPRA